MASCPAAAVRTHTVPSAFGSFQQFIDGLRAGIAGITIGWKQLLTLDVPLGEYQAVLVPLFVTFYVLSLVAFAAIARGGKLATVAVPAVVLMSAFGVFFGSSSTSNSLPIGGFIVPAAREVGLGVALVFLSLIWLVGRARIARASALKIARASTGTVRQRSESVAVAIRRNSLAVIIVALALIAGVAVTPVAAGWESRQALRDGVDPLLIVEQQPSPLSGYRSWFNSDNFDAELFSVVGAPDEVDRIRLATLDTYDGETFHVTGASGDDNNRFSRQPRTQPTSGAPAQFEISIGEGYSGIWVPVPSALAAAPVFESTQEADLSDAFYVNDENTTAINVAGVDGDRGLKPGDSYTLYASPTNGSIEDLGSESPGNSLLGDIQYPALESWVKLQAAPRNGEGLEQLITAMRERGYVSHSLSESTQSDAWVRQLEGRADFVFQPSYSGHSRARIEGLFTTLVLQQRTAGEDAPSQALVSAVGDDEQFATAGALIARQLGFESRVVLGTRLNSDEADLAVAPCDAVCTGANISAWIEVRNPSQSDWVTIDTSPQFVEPPAVISTGIDLPENPTVPDDVQSEVVDPPETERGNSELATENPEEGENWLAAWLPTIRTVGLFSLAALLLVLPLLVLVFAKSSRRRLRRSMGVPEVSIVGAWDELVDTYVDHGMVLPRASSRLDFARATQRPAAVQLATLVDRAVFAEHPPGRDISTASWQLLDAERAELAMGVPLTQRLKALVNPASFTRHFGSETRLGSVLTVFRRKEA